MTQNVEIILRGATIPNGLVHDYLIKQERNNDDYYLSVFFYLIKGRFNK